MQKHLEVFNQLVDDFQLVQQNHIGPVTLVLAENKIEIQEVKFDRGNKLHLASISKFELKHGLTSVRWLALGKIVRKNFSERSKK